MFFLSCCVIIRIHVPSGVGNNFKLILVERTKHSSIVTLHVVESIYPGSSPRLVAGAQFSKFILGFSAICWESTNRFPAIIIVLANG